MELDELKALWQAHDQQHPTTHPLDKPALRILLSERSRGVIDKMRQEVRQAGFILAAVVVFLVATILGNAFDYPHPLYHLPALVLTVVASGGLFLLIRHYRDLSQVTLFGQDTYQALVELVGLRLRFSHTMNRVWGMVMLAAMLLNVSLVARRFTAGDWLNTLLLTLLPMGITALAFGVAKWVGAFKDRYAEQLQAHLQELEALRSLTPSSSQ